MTLFGIGAWYLYVVMTVTSPITRIAEYRDERTCMAAAGIMDAEYAKRGMPAWQRPIVVCLPVSF